MQTSTPRRQYRRYTTRRTGWLQWSTGRGVDAGGAATKIGVKQDVAAVLRAMLALEVDDLIVTGPHPRRGPARATGREALRTWAWGQLEHGWTHGRHYWPDGMTPTLRYLRDGDARERRILFADSWGMSEPDPGKCAAALKHVGEWLAVECRGTPVLGSPVQTGLAAIDRMCDADRTVWTPSGQDLVREHAGQHRMEWVRDWRPDLPIDEWDMRLAYSAMAWGLGAGPEVLYKAGYFDPNARARWLVRWKAPPAWPHPFGILPQHNGERWEWPTSGEGWVDGAEVGVALRHGWDVRVLAGIGPANPKADPLGNWARKMARIVDRLDTHGDPLASSAGRMILVTAVGGLVGRPQKVWRTVPAADAHTIPAGIDPTTVRHVDDTITYAETVDAQRGDLSHPEWAAGIWGRCRARTLWKRDGTGALNLPPESVCGFRGDAIYLVAGAHRNARGSVHPDPWADSEHPQPGQWRRKRTVAARTAPLLSLADYDRARKET